ncbi:hypothetical protein UB31_18890 [Bradyrhizobium sp. LTSP849]|uniref:hypothetical protein n=1 Tax=Bradyrhizobium sp. LTSP849 TaxID=1615890 RepID=UPI0005D229E7|nr:hypothetical protein [Bradyrhizobium sp. LTSP849]KJC47322.1 hypothetical protein UB31_18890 [Bradyrhizobium sp. LTSP849]
MPESCLNEYHLQFLQLLIRRGARFLVIGGQARAVHEGVSTRDLDIWVDVAAGSRPALEGALISWTTKYPVHSAADFSPPLPLRPGVQIKFPDADVYFLGADGEPKEIGPADCIDILTSIGPADFAAHYDRADWREIAGLRLPFLARGDLDAISPPKSTP